MTTMYCTQSIPSHLVLAGETAAAILARVLFFTCCYKLDMENEKLKNVKFLQTNLE
jgi:hypothetical protein